MNTREIYAGRTTDGQVVREELPVIELPGGFVELLASPGFANDVAKGDIVEILSSEQPVKVIRRGGNVCVQVFSGLSDSEAMLKKLRLEFQESVPGSMDSATANSMCFTVPISAGFSVIERFFNEFVAEFPGIEWSYGNVYGDDGVTPLGWWLHKSDS